MKGCRADDDYDGDSCLLTQAKEVFSDSITLILKYMKTQFCFRV
jgi:hypothetical protein